MKDWIFVYINLWRVVPAWLAFKTNKFKDKCFKDLKFSVENLCFLKAKCTFLQFAYLIVNCRSFRNVLLMRLRRNIFMYAIVRVLFSPQKDLYINMPPEKIGGGLYFQHGFSTIVAAKEIGEECKIFQQVTIGFNGTESPVIGNRVSVTAGAIVIGNIHIGDDSVVGAGAVVTDDVPENMIVAGVPAKVIKPAGDRHMPGGGIRY